MKTHIRYAPFDPRTKCGKAVYLVALNPKPTCKRCKKASKKAKVRC